MTSEAKKATNRETDSLGCLLRVDPRVKSLLRRNDVDSIHQPFQANHNYCTTSFLANARKGVCGVESKNPPAQLTLWTSARNRLKVKGLFHKTIRDSNIGEHPSLLLNKEASVQTPASKGFYQKIKRS